VRADVEDRRAAVHHRTGVHDALIGFPSPLGAEFAYPGGASLARILRKLENRYTRVCCNVSGVNAFFVPQRARRGVATYPAKDLYQPPRHHLIMIAAAPSPKFLAASLRDA
jgi:hypothetical protein